MPDGDQATGFTSFLKTYLDGHPGEIYRSSRIAKVLYRDLHSQGETGSTYASRVKAIVALDSPLAGINHALTASSGPFLTALAIIATSRSPISIRP